MTQRMGPANADFTAAVAAKNNRKYDNGEKVTDISRKRIQRTKCDS